MTKMRIGFFISVVLNIFLVGALSGGAAWLNYGHRMIFAGSLRIAGSELPAPERRAFRAALRQARDDISDQIGNARNARAEAAELLVQPTLDTAEIMAALDKARIADFAVRAAIEKRAVVFAATLSKEDRAKLADAIRERIRRGIQNGR